jgi:alpha/beta superfamily hydrolase
MEPFFFSQPPLFGVYHESKDYSADNLVVICPPLFDEFRRSYRAMYEFAEACSQKGHHVMRFDYRGTGDAYGRLEDVGSLSEWVADLELAIEEGLSLSGAESVSLFGIRFGASIASMCHHPLIRKRHYWDIFETGQGYLDWLAQVDKAMLQEHKDAAAYSNVGFNLNNIEQFPLNASLKQDISQWKLDKSTVPQSCITTMRDSLSPDPKWPFVRLEYTYDWPVYENGLINPAPVFIKVLDDLAVQTG